jgi:hypothetical protein
MAKSKIAEQRDATWNVEIPSDNNGHFDSVAGKTSAQAQVGYAHEVSRAGIKVSDVDLVGHIGRKAAIAKAKIAQDDGEANAVIKATTPDFSNANYPA